ncbi:MAG: hypothetical protein QNJ85_16090 [Gammaproteobacteria bacterium]|nr:hypothetical protein [Gammaproteobacteria bacterium]
MALSAGCATTTATVKQTDKLESVDRNAKILLMTPDVKYYLLTAGGVPEPHAEWTDAARRNFAASLQAYADDNQIQIIRMPDQDQLSDTEISYQKLYSAVGSSVLSHHFGAIKLPTKQGAFDWTLGSGVSAIGQKYGADYALFSYYRDYQASGGRVAFSFFAALVGVGVATGGEFGFASLVDLRTGDIIWFNRVGRGAGELREQEQARAAVDALFKDMPRN